MKSYGIAMGGKIYSLRVAKRMTQEQLAEELCISPARQSVSGKPEVHLVKDTALDMTTPRLYCTCYTQI